MITCLHCRTPEALAREISKARALTHKPLAVNLTILGEKRGEAEFPESFVETIVGHGVEIVETCGASVPLMQKLHAALRAGGVRVIISKCVSVKQALRCERELGCDMVSLMGFDSGGLPGDSDTGVFVQMALAKHCGLRVPYLCSGRRTKITKTKPPLLLVSCSPRGAYHVALALIAALLRRGGPWVPACRSPGPGS